MATYAVGSLAHGGFSAAVSDVDFAVIVTDPLENADETRVASLAAEVRAVGLPLAERLSIFWGSPASLRGVAQGGRFPAHDRLDLIRHGRLLDGADVRAGLAEPTARELVTESATFALRVMSVPSKVTDGSLDVTALLLDPERLLFDESVRVLTKLILFPPRFLLTLDRAEPCTTSEAVDHFVRRHEGPLADLVRAGLRFRTSPPSTDSEKAALLPALRSTLIPLYLVFIDEYTCRLREYGLSDLASQLSAWGARLNIAAR